jgi:hypothetical protein
MIFTESSRFSALNACMDIGDPSKDRSPHPLTPSSSEREDPLHLGCDVEAAAGLPVV